MKGTEKLSKCKGCRAAPYQHHRNRLGDPGLVECARCGIHVKSSFIWNRIMKDSKVTNKDMVAVIPQLVAKQKKLAGEYRDLKFKYEGLKYMLTEYQKKEAKREGRK